MKKLRCNQGFLGGRLGGQSDINQKRNKNGSKKNDNMD